MPARYAHKFLRRGKPFRRARRNDFTLVEFLVVITLISILMAMLLLVLQNARTMAHTISCMNNLRNTSLYATCYVDSFHGYIHAPQGYYCCGNYWPTAMMRGNCVPDKNVLLCPYYKPFRYDPVNGGTYGEVLYNTVNLSNSYYCIKFMNIKPKSVVYLDSRTPSYRQAGTFPGGSYVHLRHNRRANAALPDGSVLTLDSKGLSEHSCTVQKTYKQPRNRRAHTVLA